MDKANNNQNYYESSTPEKQIWMLGFFDVLGFSSRVKREGIDRIYNDYQNLINNVLANHAIDTSGLIVPSYVGGDIVSMGGEVEVSYTYFSDTILLWMPLLPMYPNLFLQRCADLMCEALLMKIPLRGAISVGEGYMHKGHEIYLGEHIVDAARLEAIQEHIGASMTTSAAISALIPASFPTQYIEYESPIKTTPKYNPSEVVSPISLDWPRRWRDRELGDLERYILELRPDDSSVTKYYDNAIRFVKWSDAHHNWHIDKEWRKDFRHIKPVDSIENIKSILPKQWLDVKASVRLVSNLNIDDFDFKS